MSTTQTAGTGGVQGEAAAARPGPQPITDVTAEEWRPIPGFEGYQVSSLGRVLSLRRRGKRVLMHLNVGRTGYLRVNLRNAAGERVTKQVHRLVAEAFLGRRPDGMDTRHLDGVQTNNAAGNLRYGTRSENELDKVRHGTHQNARKTHCPQGHPYDETNTYFAPGKSNNRCCRTCIAIRSARRSERVA